jgi:hypothetical protein
MGLPVPTDLRRSIVSDCVGVLVRALEVKEKQEASSAAGNGADIAMNTSTQKQLVHICQQLIPNRGTLLPSLKSDDLSLSALV